MVTPDEHSGASQERDRVKLNHLNFVDKIIDSTRQMLTASWGEPEHNFDRLLHSYIGLVASEVY